MRWVRATLLALLIGCLAAPVGAEVQRLSFERAGWHFVSLGVRPPDSDPLSVFPVGGGFEYDHLWTFDPDDGWRHFSPLPEIPSVLNDLTSVDALAGYWIHVTRVPSGGAEIAVDGDRAVSLRLPAPQTAVESWYPIGPLLDEGRSVDNVSTVFASLGDALEDTLQEVWRYDAPTDRFVELVDFSVACASEPDSCLSAGRAYWLRTDGAVRIGPSVEATSRGIVLTGDRPFDRIDLRYEGVGAVAARLRARDPDAGVLFAAATQNVLDGVPYLELDPVADPAGPDTSADLDGDGQPEPCPDSCAGLSGCVNLCFASGGREHTVFVGIDLVTFSTLEAFSSTEPGHEHTMIYVEVVSSTQSAQATSTGAPSGRSRADEPPSSDIVDEIALAVKPAALRGMYAGVLIYEEPDSAELPFSLWLDDCVRDPATGAEECGTGRAVGILNPTLLGSAENGVDDDDDGDVDEEDEEARPIPTRTSPGFGPESVLVGDLSTDRLRIRLAGGQSVAPELSFARGRCLATLQCATTGDVCESDDDCVAADGGIAFAFATASREISLDGQRIAPEIFEGLFNDRYTGINLGDRETGISTGRFRLSRIVAPQCIAPTETPGVQPRVIGLGCREDADCPGRCVGEPSLEGFACFEDADCTGLFAGQTVSAVCEPFVCAFPEPAALCDETTSGGFAAMPCASNGDCPDGSCLKTASRKALDHTDVILRIPGIDRSAFVVMTGPTELRGLLSTETGGSLVLENLTCGFYTLSVQAPGCMEVEVNNFDPCMNEAPMLALDCPGEADVPESVAPTSAAESLELVAGSSLLKGESARGGPDDDDLELRATAGESAVAGRDPVTTWTNRLSWPGALGAIRAGLLEVF